jgi:C_GCAxxG_C_C family probable redox protein
MSRQTDRIAQSFQDGFNCSQIVLSTHAARFGLAEDVALRIASPFGGGVARTGHLCGAVTGALMALGLKFGTTRTGDKEGKERLYILAGEFMARFRERHGSLFCRELLGCDLGTPEGRQEAHDKRLVEELCTRLVADATEISAEIIER